MTNIKTCRYCNSLQPASALSCSKCGASLAGAENYGHAQTRQGKVPPIRPDPKTIGIAKK